MLRREQNAKLHWLDLLFPALQINFDMGKCFAG
jgi:hypothetical protein